MIYFYRYQPTAKNIILWTKYFIYMEDHDNNIMFDEKKNAVLLFIEEYFSQIEEELAMSHQEKYALLEDALGNAVDTDELKVAFEQWFYEHSEDVDFEHDSDELWDQAMAALDE